MNRDELIDNLTESAARGETVTLTMRWYPGMPGNGTVNRTVQTGVVVVPLAEHYTGRRALQCVFQPEGRRWPLVVGLSMIYDFQVGRPPVAVEPRVVRCSNCRKPADLVPGTGGRCRTCSGAGTQVTMPPPPDLSGEPAW